MLPAFSTPSVATAAHVWAARLDDAQLQSAAANVRAFPFEYRKELMARLTPDERAQAWLANFRAFLEEHPDLDAFQQRVVRAGMALVTPDLFTGQPAGADAQAQISAAYEVTVGALGAANAAELYLRLGPDTSSGAGVLPIMTRLTNAVRRYVTAYADDEPACECSGISDDCGVFNERGYYCSELLECQIDADYPMCGPFWSSACIGMCRASGASRH